MNDDQTGNLHLDNIRALEKKKKKIAFELGGQIVKTIGRTKERGYWWFPRPGRKQVRVGRIKLLRDRFQQWNESGD